MVKQVGYNWHNEFIQCSEDYGCFYKNKKCFNPQHMTVKDYESHFKAKMNLRTMKKFKKTLEHYIPGDNVLYAIIEQTKFFKKTETETIVKTWEENWMSGAWAEAIAHADEVMVKQEFHSLVKIMLNYVRLFVHSEAKYATQDYIKAVMIQDYVGEVFTESHYKTLTAPWLSAKNVAQPHFWRYINRHLNVPTMPLPDMNILMGNPETTTAAVDKNASALLETQPIFADNDDFLQILNNTGESERIGENFWHEKVGVSESLTGDTPVEDFETVLFSEDEEQPVGNKILNNISVPFNKIADYLGYTNTMKNTSNEVNVEYELDVPKIFNTEDIILPNFYEERSRTVTDLVKKSVENKAEKKPEDASLNVDEIAPFAPAVAENVSKVEKTETVANFSNEEALNSVPEHLQDFVKTIYFREK
jgi:hypothetical protein